MAALRYLSHLLHLILVLGLTRLAPGICRDDFLMPMLADVDLLTVTERCSFLETLPWDVRRVLTVCSS